MADCTFVVRETRFNYFAEILELWMPRVGWFQSWLRGQTKTCPF